MREWIRKVKDLWPKARALWDEFSKITAATYASSISYFTFLSLVPMLAICISLLSMFGVSAEELITFLQALLPDALDELVKDIVSDAYARSGIAFSLSSLTLLWSASKGAKALRVGLNAAYAQKETRKAITVIIISIVAGLILDALLAATIYLVFSDSIIKLLSTLIPGLAGQDFLIEVLETLITIAAGILTFSACYAFLPAGTRRMRSQLPGAVCAVLASGALTFGFRIYIDNFNNYSAVYGSLATVAILLFWMYLVSFIIVAGGFINRLLMVRASIRNQPRKPPNGEITVPK